MLSYQEDRKLERLLEELYLDDNELAEDDIVIVGWPIIPILLPSSGNCCTYNYASYNS